MWLRLYISQEKSRPKWTGDPKEHQRLALIYDPRISSNCGFTWLGRERSSQEILQLWFLIINVVLSYITIFGYSMKKSWIQTRKTLRRKVYHHCHQSISIRTISLCVSNTGKLGLHLAFCINISFQELFRTCFSTLTLSWWKILWDERFCWALKTKRNSASVSMNGSWKRSFQVFGTFGTLQSKEKNQISLLCSMFGKIPVEVRPPVRSHIWMSVSLYFRFLSRDSWILIKMFLTLNHPGD